MDRKTKIEFVVKILNRTEEMGIITSATGRENLFLDLLNAEREVGMRFDDFLKADDLNFSHDIYGIMKNMNRETMKLDNFFLPRFAESR